MKNSISKRDWETISAYLDGQLSQREQVRFESRLYSDRQLQVALDDLRRTHQALRGAPKLRAPRNFLLTPEIAGNPVRIPRLAPVFGWASAVASFLLVLVLVGDFYTNGGFAPVEMITSQNNVFYFQQSEIFKGDVLAQPAISEDMSVSSNSFVESEQEAAPLEMSAEVAPMDTAAYEPTMELEESVGESQESELLAMKNAADAEEPASEDLDGIMAVNGEDVSSSDLPPESPVENSEEESVEPQETIEVMAQSSVDLTKDAETIDLANIEAVQETLTETVEIEEVPVREVVEEPEQPPVTTAESAMIADEKTYLREQQISENSNTAMAVEPMPADTLSELETIPGTVTATKNESSLVLGLEVILAMGALGTGLAWIYTRRRAG